MHRARRGVRQAAALSAVLAATLLAGCSGAERGGDATSDQAPSRASSTTSVEDTADQGPRGATKNTVPEPGPFSGRLFGDDLLVVADKTIDPAAMKKLVGVTVRGKRGVAAYQPFSYGQAPLENKLYNIAAVDPGKFRAFTGGNSAAFQEQWDRIADGEIAVSRSLQKDIALGDDGFLEVGGERIHVGAWSPSEVDNVDAMVNAKWGEALDLPRNNAVLINTGITSPQAVRAAIEKAVGKTTYSITALDIVAQAGIDLDTFQTVVPVGTFRDAVGVFRYTPIGGGRIAPDPAWVRQHIVTAQVPILGTVTCNKFMIPQLRAALAEVVQSKLADKINPREYAGCYYPRFIAGSSSLSNHSFGLALDFNVPGNQRGTVGQMDRNVVAIFKRWGFGWGGDWAYTDPMHFEVQRIVNPGKRG